MIITGTHEEKPLIARFDTSSEQLKGRYSVQVGVAIPLNDPTPEGLPTPGEDEQLGTIEATLLRKIDQQCVLVGVITTAGMREFVLYTNSSAWIEAFHQAFQAAVPTHQVQVMAKTDPDWSVYRSFVS
ncbi:MAG: DUF695 domain-containing protein [Acidimicrobiia bacterium]|nr:DUF695 domain-containing protein [Acidimicrobiia bacterium]